MDVDVLLLSRDPSPLRRDVREGIEAQERAGVRLRVHRVFGPPRPEDPNRWETIARARNEGKRLGSSPWVLYLDDDVVLAPRCVASLVEGLQRRPGFAALAADCAGEMDAGWDHWDYPRHVGMASTMFRRERLAGVTFRWEPDKCECRCCCDDLRRDGFAIGYLPGAEARHRPAGTAAGPAASAEDRASGDPRPAVGAPTLPGRVLAAFDRRHLRRFRRRFLATLRGSGNDEPVTAVVTGLLPSEQRALALTPGVEVRAVPRDGHPAQRRLQNFGAVIEDWPEETPVAYWDAGDVVFQGRIGPLWDLVRAHPDRLLAAREAVPFGRGTVAQWWAETIADPASRKRAVDLFMTRPVLNAGFAAGTARAMLRYLRGADALLHSTALHGSTDWGDQTAMNLYCHTNPDAWHEVPMDWNYCLVGLGPRDYRVRRDGQIERADGALARVVHGAGDTLGAMTLSFLD